MAWGWCVAHATLCRESRAGIKNDGIHWTWRRFALVDTFIPFDLELYVLGCGVGGVVWSARGNLSAEFAVLKFLRRITWVPRHQRASTVFARVDLENFSQAGVSVVQIELIKSMSTPSAILTPWRCSHNKKPRHSFITSSASQTPVAPLAPNGTAVGMTQITSQTNSPITYTHTSGVNICLANPRPAGALSNG